MTKKNKVRDARFSHRPSAPEGGRKSRPSESPPGMTSPSREPSAPSPKWTSSVKPPASAGLPTKVAMPPWLSVNLLVPVVMVLGAAFGLTVWYRDTHPGVLVTQVDAGAPAVAPEAVDARTRETPEVQGEASARGEAIESLVPLPTTPDPMHGVFTLAQATEGVPGTGVLAAEIETSMGTFTCTLLPEDAPLTVANFIGLATGRRHFWDTVTGNWTRRAFYDGSIFHRVIPGFMIQGGDVLRSGFGATGYEIRDENVRGHDAAGQLCMANHGPNTNGGQFFITEGPRGHLDGSYSIFGRCRPSDLVGRIARVPVTEERPRSPVFIRHVRIVREPTR